MKEVIHPENCRGTIYRAKYSGIPKHICVASWRKSRIMAKDTNEMLNKIQHGRKGKNVIQNGAKRSWESLATLRSIFPCIIFVMLCICIPMHADPLDKAFKQLARTLISDIAKDTLSQKRLVILNFTNDNPDTNSNERCLGIYLVKIFSYYVNDECKRKGIDFRNRKLGEEVTMQERMYRKSISADSVLYLLQADYYIVGTYHLYENELEIQELVAIRSIGSQVISIAKPCRIKLSPDEYVVMKEKEDRIVIWKEIDPKLLTFLVQTGKWKNNINIEIRDFYTNSKLEEKITLDKFIKIHITLDSVPAYLYVIGWDQELNFLSFLYPNSSDVTNPVTKRIIKIPAKEDSLAFPIKGPVKNKKDGDYNWIKVFASKKPIKSFWVTDGFIPITTPQLKNISDELNSLGLQNWSSKIVDFWVKEKE